MKILMVTPEMVPFVKTGGLADVAGALPLELSNFGCDVSVILPCYKGLEKKYNAVPADIKVTVPVPEGEGWSEKKGEILKTETKNGVDVYLVKMDEYFDRDQLYSSEGKDYDDNSARFTFFCKAALELVKNSKKAPDIIHCHDWQSSLVPVLLKTVFKDTPGFKNISTLTTIHNLGFQGVFWYHDMKLMGIPEKYFSPDYLEFFGNMNLLKGAIIFSDIVTTVSEGYAREIQTEEFGYGLEGVIKNRGKDLYGIINGIDYDIWDPAIDNNISKNYSAFDLSGKAECKKALQKYYSLPEKPKTPLIAMISRLTDQKGFDLVAANIEKIVGAGLQFVLLGTGDKYYADFFKEMALKHPDHIGVKIAYDEKLAHVMEAGADIFLMPSKYEPCGLNQMISMKYGTVPVVKAVGGLDDTIDNWDPKTKKGNGFKFLKHTKKALWDCMETALENHKDTKKWEVLVKNAMKEDHSWTASAKEYMRLYRKMSGK
jgi:starch synthase